MGTVVFHVSSTDNRESIARHGLDSQRWLGHPGVAGPDGTSEHSAFLARDEDEVEWFISMSRRHLESVDVWEVTLPHDLDLYAYELPAGTPYEEVDGYLCTTEPIPPESLRLLRSGT